MVAGMRGVAKKVIAISIIVLAGPAAYAQTRPQEYDIHPPTSSIQRHDVGEHISGFIYWQAAGFVSGAIATRALISPLWASVLSGGLIGGFAGLAYL